MRTRALTAAIAACAVLGCPAGAPDRASERDTSANAAADSVARTAAPLWYRRARALDLTSRELEGVHRHLKPKTEETGS